MLVMTPSSPYVNSGQLKNSTFSHLVPGRPPEYGSRAVFMILCAAEVPVHFIYFRNGVPYVNESIYNIFAIEYVRCIYNSQSLSQ